MSEDEKVEGAASLDDEAPPEIPDIVSDPREPGPTPPSASDPAAPAGAEDASSSPPPPVAKPAAAVSKPPPAPSARRAPTPPSARAQSDPKIPVAPPAPRISERPRSGSDPPPAPSARRGSDRPGAGSGSPPPPRPHSSSPSRPMSDRPRASTSDPPEADASESDALPDLDEVREPGGPAARSVHSRRGRRSLLSIPDDDVPVVPSETQQSALAAMRIVAVGETTSDEAPPEITEDDVEIASPSQPPPKPKRSPSKPEMPVVVPESAPVPELKEEREGDSVEDAPDSGEPISVEPVPDSAERISIEAEPELPKPPPPPRKKTEKKAPPLPAESKPRKRPWWEELFGDDFSRSHSRLTEKQIRQESSFIEDSLGVAKGGVVLDLACGAGHHAVELASRGYGVVGYDLSLTQLALAADVAQERDQKINFLQGDMREMAFEEMFDGIYCWNTSFGYFEEEKNLVVAERIFKALRPGGMFLLDVANRDFVVDQQPTSVWYEGDGCVCMDDMRIDFITSRLRCKRTVMLDDGRTLECNYSIRLYGLHELGKMLHDIGFRVTEASGHPATPGVFFGGSSPRIIILAERPD